MEEVMKTEKNQNQSIFQKFYEPIGMLANLNSLLTSNKTTIIGTILLVKISGFSRACSIILKSRFSPLFLSDKSVRYNFIHEFR